jgi:hypothetical protein
VAGGTLLEDRIVHAIHGKNANLRVGVFAWAMTFPEPACVFTAAPTLLLSIRNTAVY